MTISVLLCLMVLGIDWAQLGGSRSESPLGWQSDCSQAGSSEGCLTHRSGAWAWEDRELGKTRVTYLCLHLSLSHCSAWSLQHGNFRVAQPLTQELRTSKQVSQENIAEDAWPWPSLTQPFKSSNIPPATFYSQRQTQRPAHLQGEET